MELSCNLMHGNMNPIHSRSSLVKRRNIGNRTRTVRGVADEKI